MHSVILYDLLHILCLQPGLCRDGRDCSALFQRGRACGSPRKINPSTKTVRLAEDSVEYCPSEDSKFSHIQFVVPNYFK